MRGKVGWSLSRSRRSGITPAYAGKSLAGRCPAPAGLGSPPRMRGKVHVRPTRSLQRGITPAYAGKRLCRMQARWSAGDHPRVCGEKGIQGTVGSFSQGSPPRMRGKGASHAGSGVRMGITPAYAGKSMPGMHRDLLMEDHPRVCGEKASFPSLHRQPLGSPPRMRGKASVSVSGSVVTGITPAYAGKSIPLWVNYRH